MLSRVYSITIKV